MGMRCPVTNHVCWLVTVNQDSLPTVPLDQPGFVLFQQMDEEDLYSAVGRQPHAHASSSGRPSTEDADAANDTTFGEAGPSSSQPSNNAGPARTAWTGAGTSVAVVAGSSR